jgi:hypothetical protein
LSILGHHFNGDFSGTVEAPCIKGHFAFDELPLLLNSFINILFKNFN